MNTALRIIGTTAADEKGFYIDVNEEYAAALKGIEDFSHIYVIWWADHFEADDFRSILETQKPYKNAPETLGIFATRSPIRPNPIMMTASRLLEIDGRKLRIDYIDAEPHTPVVDIKPYYPCSDFVTTAQVPSWADSWPKSLEASADFDWGSVFEDAH